MVLVRDRGPEQRHDPVAGELVHGALEPPDALGEQREEALHDLTPLLGVGLLGHVHRAHDVGEQDGHLLALAVERRRFVFRPTRGRRRLHELLPAGVAEALAGGILGTAARTLLSAARGSRRMTRRIASRPGSEHRNCRTSPIPMRGHSYTRKSMRVDVSQALPFGRPASAGYPHPVPLSVPSPPTTNPLARIRADLGAEWRAARRVSLPPGSKLPSIVLTERMRRDPLSVLLAAYEEYGPIFSIRIFHSIIVFMLGPEANRFILVTDRDKFRWRDGSLGDLIPLIGDGLLTTDGEYHDRARRIMLPLFHRERIAAAAGIMTEEAERALDGWRPGDRVDLYDWTRHVAMRVAMRALFGFDPDRVRRRRRRDLRARSLLL